MSERQPERAVSRSCPCRWKRPVSLRVGTAAWPCARAVIGTPSDRVLNGCGAGWNLEHGGHLYHATHRLRPTAGRSAGSVGRAHRRDCAGRANSGHVWAAEHSLTWGGCDGRCRARWAAGVGIVQIDAPCRPAPRLIRVSGTATHRSCNYWSRKEGMALAQYGVRALSSDEAAACVKGGDTRIGHHLY